MSDNLNYTHGLYHVGKYQSYTYQYILSRLLLVCRSESYTGLLGVI